MILTVKDSVLTDTAADRVGEITAAVAEHVRELRTARGWSLDELAGRSGVSKGMVVQVEGARTNPSIGTLCRLADAFGVTIAELLAPVPERSVQVSDADHAPVLWRGPHGGYGRLLRGVNHPALVELWQWRLAPGERYQAPEGPPEIHELLHVLSGEVTVTVGGADHPATSGQTIGYPADRPHILRNDGAAAVELLMVEVIPSGEWDRRRSGHQ
jgi:transcriptional regulator with XRE-family HTH domain